MGILCARGFERRLDLRCVREKLTAAHCEGGDESTSQFSACEQCRDVPPKGRYTRYKDPVIPGQPVDGCRMTEFVQVPPSAPLNYSAVR